MALSNPPDPSPEGRSLLLSQAVTLDTTRVSGESPPELSVNVSRLVYPSREVFWRPRAVILAPETDAAQAAAAVPLIHFPRNAPLLLTAQETLSLPVRQELIRLQPPGIGTDGRRLPAQVFLVGPLGAGVERAVQSLGFTIFRLGGATPFQTAAEVTRFLLVQPDGPSAIIVAGVADFRDWLAAPSQAAHTGAGILYVTRDSIAPETEAILRQLPPVKVYIIGSERTVSRGVENRIRDLAPGQVVRIDGDSPFDIAVKLAQFFDPAGMFGWGRFQPDGDTFTFVPVDDWVPAVVGALPSHIGKHAPVIPIGIQGIPRVVRDYLLSVNPVLGHPPAPPFMHGLIIARPNQITFEQQVELESLLIKEAGEWPPPGSHPVRR